MKVFDHTGRKIGSWTVVEKLSSTGRKLYRLKCDCGKERTCSSSKITRKCICVNCLAISTNNSYSGERSGRLLCLGHHLHGKRHGLLVQCDCGKRIVCHSYHHFLNSQSCKSCRTGFYPGKKVGNCCLIERVSRWEWKKKCLCGNIFTAPSRKNDCGCVREGKIIQDAEAKIGMSYFYLTIKKIAKRVKGHVVFLIRCKCGKEFTQNNGHEFKGKSCGCMLSIPVGENSSKATMKNFEVVSIRELYKSGSYTLEDLSKIFNKSPRYLWRIVNNRIWKHV